MSLIQTHENTDAMSQLAEHFSSWYKLKKATAWLMRLKEILLNLSQKRKEFQQAISQCESNPSKVKSLLQQKILKYKKSCEKRALTIEDLSKAESELIRLCQKQKYAEEIKALQQDKGHVSLCHARQATLHEYWCGLFRTF